MAYSTKVGKNVKSVWNRPMAYVQALILLLRGYSHVTILDDHQVVEARIQREPNGSIGVWTPDAKRKWQTSRYVGTLMPQALAMA
jgi:hypothetical protein